MARQRKSQAMTDAKKFYRLLLWEASGGNLGTKPEIEVKNQTADFGEKKGLLSEIIKLATLEQKAIEDEPEVSGLDMIRKQLNGDRTDRSGRDIERATESSADDGTEGNSEFADEGS